MKIVVIATAIVVALAATHTQAAFPPEVAALMDTTADPCDDFYRYTCGGWVNNYTLPGDQASFTYGIDTVQTRNKPIIQEILQQDWPLVGELYDSCMALDKLTALGNEPLQNDLARIQAVTTKKHLAKLIGNISSIGPSLFTTIGVQPDLHDATINVLSVASASFVLPSKDYYTDPARFTPVNAPFREYISTMVSLARINLNSSNPQGWEDNGRLVEGKYVADVVINTEKRFAAIQSTGNESDGYFAVTYTEAATKYPLMFGATAKGRGILKRSAMAVDSKVFLPSPAFMERAENLFTSLDLEDLKLYYSFRYANSFAHYLGKDFVHAKFDFFGKTLRGIHEHPSREKMCSNGVIGFLPDLVGKYYFLKAFDVDREQNVHAMVSLIKQAMGDHIAKLTWLDDATRDEAATKLAKVTTLIGHSTKKKSYPFVLTRDNFFANVLTLRTQGDKEVLARINQRVDRSKWDMSAATVNAYYSPLQNKIVFPAAILQPPFYSGGAHPVQNFGAIGAVVGHELTHAFDRDGRRHDGDGNKRDWWTETAAEEFNTRATCMANQYSEMVAYGDTDIPVGNVDGNLTLSENIADNGGVSLAFDAYHNWVKSGAKFDAKGVKDKEVDKLFFVSFAQIWCGQIRDEALDVRLLTDAHSPKTARVNGVAMNSEQFAKTFQCEVGSKMNPKNKCRLW